MFGAAVAMRSFSWGPAYRTSQCKSCREAVGVASIGLGPFLQAAHNSLIVQRIAAKPAAHKRASGDSGILYQLRSVAARPVRGRSRSDSDDCVAPGYPG